MGIGLTASTEGTVDHATQDEGLPGASAEVIEERRDLGARVVEVPIADGADGLVGHSGVGILDEAGDRGVGLQAQGDDGGEANRRTGVGGEGVERFGREDETREREGASGAERRVAIGVGGE